jgi:hypothetical protein
MSTYTVNYSPEEIKKAHEVLYNEGLKMRIKVAGQDYVERSLKAATDPFAKPMQEVMCSSIQTASIAVIQGLQWPVLTFSPVCCGSVLGMGLVSGNLGTQDAVVSEHCYALLPEPRHRACHACPRCAQQRRNRGRNTRGDLAGGRILWNACGH